MNNILTKTKGLRVNYDYEKQKWIVETPIVMNAIQLQKVLFNARGQISYRIKGEIGDRRKRMEEAFQRMIPEHVEQWLIGNGEKTLYLAPNQKL